jgi:hypothetical protein
VHFFGRKKEWRALFLFFLHTMRDEMVVVIAVFSVCARGQTIIIKWRNFEGCELP